MDGSGEARRDAPTRVVSDRELSPRLGEVVKAWRTQRGWSLTEFAKHASLTKGYVSQLEHSKIRHPSDRHLLQLADALHVPVEDLLTRRLPPAANEAVERPIAAEH